MHYLADEEEVVRAGSASVWEFEPLVRNPKKIKTGDARMQNAEGKTYNETRDKVIRPKDQMQ